MKKSVTVSLAAVMAVAMIIIMAIDYALSTENRKNNACLAAQNRMEQLNQTIKSNRAELSNLWDSLSEDYLTRAKAFAYMISVRPAVLESQAELENIRRLLNVDELHVIDENGILQYGTIPKYFGMDFNSTDQTREFLSILDEPEKELVQDIRPNGAEEKLFQYVGVARIDKKGIVQVGLNPSRYMEAKRRNELSYLFARIPIDRGCFMEAVDPGDGTALAYTNRAYINNSVPKAFSPDRLALFQDGNTHSFTENGVFYVARQYDEVILCVGQLTSELYRSRNLQLTQTFFCLLFICLIVIFVLYQILQKKIIRGIYKIILSLKKITGGDLDTEVAVGGNPEFKQLSGEINHMVQSILNTTGKLSRIIDMVGAPIGVFEYNKGMNRVLATERTGEILNLDKTEEKRLFQDKEQFSAYIRSILERQGEDGSCKIDGEPERWIRLLQVEEEQGIFGIVQDVTQEVNEKLKILEERDYDALTGLCSRRRFEEETERLLKEGRGENSAMVMFDLDSFKQINDSFGHGFGDLYLKHIASIFSKWKSGPGIAGRRSGDEFYVFLYECRDREEVQNQMERFYEMLEQYPIAFPDGRQRAVRVSSGFAWHGDGKRSFYELLEMADAALYQAKKTNRGYFCEFGETGKASVMSEAVWSNH